MSPKKDEPQLAVTVSASGVRYYRNPITMERVPSVTTVLGVKDKPALMWWSAGMAAEAAMEEYVNWPAPVPLEDENGDQVQDAFGNVVMVAPEDWGTVEVFDKKLDRYVMKDRREVVYAGLRSAHNRYRDKKADMGSQTHSVVEAYAKGLPMPEFDDDSRRYVGPVLRWLAERPHVKFLQAETTVWSESAGYAGTLDSIWDFSMDGEPEQIWMLDTKTGNDVWPEVVLQLAALGVDTRILHPNGVQEDLPNVTHYGVLHIIPDHEDDDGNAVDGWVALHEVTEFIADAYDAFLGLRRAYRWGSVENRVKKHLQGVKAK